MLIYLQLGYYPGLPCAKVCTVTTSLLSVNALWGWEQAVFIGTKQYSNIFSLAHDKEEKSSKKPSFQDREANAIPSLGAGCASTGVMCREGDSCTETLGTGDDGYQAFKNKSLIVTITGCENFPVYQCKLVDIFTTELTHRVMLVKGPRKK